MVVVRSAIGCRVSPIGHAVGCARPLTSCWSDTIRPDSRSSRALTVSRTVFRLVISEPITASRSAMVEVSDAVRASRELTVPPSPWRTWMISKESWLMSFGFSAWNSGLKPLNTTVRFSGGRVWLTGTVAPGRQHRVHRPVAAGDLEVPLPDQVLVLDREDRRRPGACGLSSTLNETSATSRSTSWTSVTWPTRTPAIRTSLPAMRPEASVNRAL